MNKIVLDIVPPTSTSQSAGTRIGRLKDGRPVVFKSKQQNSAIEMYATLLAPHKPKQMTEKAVILEVLFVFPWRAKDSKKVRAGGDIFKTTKPDCDNMGKALIDVMTQLKFWADDAQIAKLSISKMFGDNPRVEIRWCILEGEAPK